jgi:GTPase
MGFNNGLQVAPERVTQSKKQTWESVVSRSSKVLTFLDMCGHEKYLKTTIFGLVGLLPDYCMIVIGSNMGLTRMSKEHIGLALALKLPMFFVLTKTDLAPENIYKDNLNLLKKILKSPAGGKMPIEIDEKTDVLNVAQMMESKAAPIFSVSSVTGVGLEQLRLFLSALQTRTSVSGFGSYEEPAEMLIDGVYMVKGAGLVVSGVLKSGTVKVGDSLCLGPDSSGNYKQITVRGIHILRESAEQAVRGQSVCFNIKALNAKEVINRSFIKKGMVVVDKALCAQTAWEFDAEVVILHHSTTIKVGYQPTVHIGVVRQAASIVNMTRETLRQGDQALIKLRFAYHPELIHPGMNILFREGRTKGIGVISQVFPINNKENH